MLGERLHPDRLAQVEGRAQVLAGLGPAALTAQPLADEEVGASDLDRQQRPLEASDCGAERVEQ